MSEMIIVTSSILQNGVENLWPAGLSIAGIPKPGFIEYMPEAYIWAFIMAFPFAFCKKKYWFIDRRDMPFDCFDPIVEKMNAKRRALFKNQIRMAIYDETMCPWLPKKTRFGGFPLLIFMPRKPHPFGLVFRNAMEAITCIMMEQEVVKAPELEDQKLYVNEESFMPDKSLIPRHVAECMRLGEASGLTFGDFACGDSYFGGVETVVQLKADPDFRHESAFVVKNNSKWFPGGALLRILSARHGDKKLGKWAVMTTTISGVKLMAIAWAWHPTEKPAFYVSSCGSTAPSDRYHLSEIDTGLGRLRKKVPCPKIISIILDLLSVIDEHNKKHSRRELPLYESWPTNHCWFRGTCCLLGQSVVDELHAFKRHDPDKYQNMSVTHFTEEVVAGTLRPWPRQYAGSLQRTRMQMQRILPGQKQLLRIEGKNGHGNYDVTDADKARGRQIGRNINQSCFMCRKYRAKPHMTTYCCKDCGTYLCHIDRFQEPGRNQSCKNEHWYSSDARIKCNGIQKKTFPRDLKVYE